MGGRAVALDAQGDRIESYEMMNYVLRAGGGLSSVPVGMYNSSLQQYQAYEKAVVIWPGNLIAVPQSHFPVCSTHA